MRLRCDPAGAGRPDQVLKAIGVHDVVSICRTELVLANVSPARMSWRRRGRYAV
jgi:hypothetical protein